ncbi:hypothetical protein Ddye_012640 [Dipteronia dyeriana]|uniref:Uncharacterized protein n=1 Tax=Dipteronia dyeriana TaxID=168575 RepID=A0AAD9X4T1_9ROSI|nr:hypothetical protein Ddye_012640 [Dipteronia dyeriana]
MRLMDNSSPFYLICFCDLARTLNSEKTARYQSAYLEDQLDIESKTQLDHLFVSTNVGQKLLPVSAKDVLKKHKPEMYSVDGYEAKNLRGEPLKRSEDALRGIYNHLTSNSFSTAQKERQTTL